MQRNSRQSSQSGPSSQSARRIGPAIAILLSLALVPFGALRSEIGAQDLQGAERQFVEAVRKARQSVVVVRGQYELPGVSEEWEIPGLEAKDLARFRTTYSGVIASPDGQIVTVGAAVSGCLGVDVILPGGEEYPAEVLGIDEKTNLAVLKISAENLPAVQWAREEELEPGAWIIAVGNPFGLGVSVSQGIVSGLDRNVSGKFRTYRGLIQLSAPVNPGDAGGLVANMRGDLVGVVSSTYQRAPSIESLRQWVDQFMGEADLSRLAEHAQRLMKDFREEDSGKFVQELARVWGQASRRGKKSRALSGKEGAGPWSGHLLGAEGISFAVPVGTVRSVTEKLIREGKVRQGRLGVWLRPLGAALRAHLDLPPGKGLLVVRVVEGSPAARAGLEPWDVLVRFGEIEIATSEELRRAMAERKSGDKVTVEVLRKGNERQSFTVEIQEAQGEE